MFTKAKVYKSTDGNGDSGDGSVGGDGGRMGI